VLDGRTFRQSDNYALAWLDLGQFIHLDSRRARKWDVRPLELLGGGTVRQWENKTGGMLLNGKVLHWDSFRWDN
jgi:hypothetical protein